VNGEEILSIINFDNLLKLGFAVIDARYCDYEVSKEKYKFVVIRVNGDRDSFYFEMFKKYIPDFKTDKNIYELWSSILSHKINMSKVLNRDISIKVALFDFLAAN